MCGLPRRTMHAVVTLMTLGTLGSPIVAQDFGDQQVSRMLQDRPSMREIIPREHAIYRFVTKRFLVGGLREDRVYWDRTEPIEGAENLCRTSCVVRVTASDEYSGRDKWAMLVFELFNLTHADSARQLALQAVQNQIERDEFIIESLKLELDAMKHAQAFFAKNPVPGVKRGTDEFYFGFLRTPSDLVGYLRFLDHKQDGYDLREYNGEVYDLYRQYGLRRRGRISDESR